MDNVERYISLAEIAYKSGNVSKSIVYAKAALKCDITPEKVTALRIFIARGYSKIGKIEESNKVYRALLTEKNYLPPIVMGLLHNNFKQKDLNTQKISRNLGLMKVWVR
ncbi:MAG: hypothetical protein LBG88_00860 [Christensenellaceae bacterium]|jgi:hypothetical protein|nr:hypothetical protein [Christensenellaceae bacterium]